MFTVCPKCALTLVVTAADLRIAQGYVRCGRCSSVFNALPHLTDERPPPLALPSELPQPLLAPHAALEDAHDSPALPAEELPAEQSAAEELAEASPPVDEPAAEDPDAVTGEAVAPAQDDLEEPAEEVADEEAQLGQDLDATGEAPQLASPGAHAEDLAAADDADSAPGELATAVDALETSTAEDSSTNPVIPEEALEFDPARADVGAVFVAAPPDPEFTAATGTFRQLIALKEEGHAAGAVARTGAPDAPAEKSAAHGAEAVTVVPHPAGAQVPADTKPAASDAAETLFGDAPAPEPSLLTRVPRSLWRIAVPLALLVLLTQILNHNRDALAADARFSRPVTALYGALGIRLVPNWDLHAYDVRQLGAEASPAGSGLITVHASIKNGAAQPQPLPLLRVTLQDRFGNRIAARDVAPHGYLPGAVTLSYLSAGQRIDAQMGFVDPGANAVGFEIDACLPASAGGIACANDVAAR